MIAQSIILLDVPTQWPELNASNFNILPLPFSRSSQNSLDQQNLFLVLLFSVFNNLKLLICAIYIFWCESINYSMLELSRVTPLIKPDFPFSRSHQLSTPSQIWQVRSRFPFHMRILTLFELLQFLSSDPQKPSDHECINHAMFRKNCFCPFLTNSCLLQYSILLFYNVV